MHGCSGWWPGIVLLVNDKAQERLRSVHRLLDGPQGLNIPRHSHERGRIPPQTIRQCRILNQTPDSQQQGGPVETDGTNCWRLVQRNHATRTENDEIPLTKVFVDKIRGQLKGSSEIPEPPVIRVHTGGPARTHTKIKGSSFPGI